MFATHECCAQRTTNIAHFLAGLVSIVVVTGATAAVEPVGTPGILVEATAMGSTPPFFKYDPQAHAPSSLASGVAYYSGGVLFADGNAGALTCYGFCDGRSAPGGEARLQIDARTSIEAKLEAIAERTSGQVSVRASLYDTLRNISSPLSFTLSGDSISTRLDPGPPHAYFGAGAILFAHDGTGYNTPLIGLGFTKTNDANGVQSLNAFSFIGQAVTFLNDVPADLTIQYPLPANAASMDVRLEVWASAGTTDNVGIAHVKGSNTFNVQIDGAFESVGGFGWTSPVPEPASYALLLSGLALVVAARKQAYRRNLPATRMGSASELDQRPGRRS